jgi:hypothetical protein
VLALVSGMLCFFCRFSAVTGKGCESIFTTTVVLFSIGTPFKVNPASMLFNPDVALFDMLIFPVIVALPPIDAEPPIVVDPPIFVLPLIFAVPTTSSVAVGVIVPIPRFPEVSKRPTSTPNMRNGIIFCEGSRLLISISFGGKYID